MRHKHGKAVSRLRKGLRERALEYGSVDDLAVSKLRKRMGRGYYEQPTDEQQRLRVKESPKLTPSLLRHKSLKRIISTADKIDIVHRVLVQKEKQSEVAKHYRRTVAAISRIVCAITKKPAILSEMLALRAEKQSVRE